MREQRSAALISILVILVTAMLLVPVSVLAGDYSLAKKLLPGTPASGASFGDAVAIDGEVAVVAAPGEGGKGAVYLYANTTGGWVRKARLAATDGDSGDLFGTAVAISGDVVAVGAPTDDNANGVDAGAVYLFEKPQGGWVDMGETTKLIAADGAENQTFGKAVAIEGSTLVTGASGHANGATPGAVYVYEKSGGNWSQAARLTASGGVNGDLFGFSLDFDGDRIVVGAYGRNQNRGAVYLFDKPGAGWTEATEDRVLTASDGSAGDHFGYTVTLDPGYVIAGADRDDDMGADSGAIYLFSVADWSEQKIVPDDSFPNQGFGYAVAAGSGRVAVGAVEDDDKGSGSGSIYIYHLASGSWQLQEKITAPDGGAGDRLGSAVAVSGSNVVAGAYGDIVQGRSGAGSAYLFTQTTTGNRAPLAQDDSFETGEGRKLTTGNVLANDSDPDGDSITISAADTRSAQGGDVADNGDGTFTYTPPAGFSGGDSFTYHISDGKGGGAQATVHITVTTDGSDGGDAGDSGGNGDSGGSGSGGGPVNPWLLLTLYAVWKGLRSNGANRL